MKTPVPHVQMLGGFSLQTDAGEHLSKLTRQATSLLAFLVLHRDRAQTRDLLAGRFWSDLPEDRARRRLTSTLWQINRAWRSLEHSGDIELTIPTNTTIQLNPALAVVVDVEVFERRLDAFERRLRTDRRATMVSELTAVVSSYRGELMAGHYDEWIEPFRNQTRNRYLDALVQLEQLTVSEGDYVTALRHARTLVELEPLREEWQQDVMRLCALSGQPTAAEAQFERYRGLLASEEMGDPGPEMITLINRIRHDAAQPPPVVRAEDGPSRLPLVGRGEERSDLLARVNELVGGKGGIALVEGSAGVGKSRLLEEVAQGAEWRGAQVLVGHHTEGNPQAYEGLREALVPATTGFKGEHVVHQLQPVMRHQASAVLPGLAELVGPGRNQQLPPADEPWRAAEALAQVILALSTPRPTLLVLEDIHWCDEDTMRVLLQLGDRLLDAGVLVAVTYQLEAARRSRPIWDGLSELEAKPGSSRLVVGPLAEADVRQLVTGRLGPGRLPERAMHRLIDTAGGNPAVVFELLRDPPDVLDESAFTLDDLSPSGELARRVPHLAELLGRRVALVDGVTRKVLDVVAVASLPLTSEVICRMSGLDRHLALPAIQNGIEMGLLEEHPRGRVQFGSEQNRRAVYDMLTSDARMTLHGSVVDGLVGEPGVVVEQLAHHARLGGQWLRAHQYYSLAAEAALRANAYQTTAEHFARADEAARASGLSDADRAEDLLEAERVLDILGRRDEQQEILDRLAGVDLPVAMTVEVRRRQAWLLANTSRTAEAVELARETISLAQEAEIATGELLTIVGCALEWSGDAPAAVAPLEAAVAELGSSREALPAQVMLGRLYATLGDLDAAAARLEAARDKAEEGSETRHLIDALDFLGAVHQQQGDSELAEDGFDEALKLAVDIGYRHGEGRTLVNLAVFAVQQGRSSLAVPRLEQAAKVFASLGNRRGEAFVKTNAADIQHQVLGQDNEAWDLAVDAARFFRSVGDERTEAHCLHIQAGVQRRRGRRRHARNLLGEALTKAAHADDRDTEIRIHRDLAQVELELGHLDDAAEHLAVALDLCGYDTSNRQIPPLLAIEAKVLSAKGEMDDAVSTAERTVAINRPGIDQAHLTAWWCAEVFTAAGLDEQAAEQVALAWRLLSAHLEGAVSSVVDHALTEVPDHRAIVEARERYFEERIERLLPAIEAPTGRPLELTDLVEVTLTVSHPDDWATGLPGTRRRRRVQRLCREAYDQNALARISDLAAALRVSERTIKRDLAQLRSEGIQPPTRGAF